MRNLKSVFRGKKLLFVATFSIITLFSLLTSRLIVSAHYTGFDQSDANRGKTIPLNSWINEIMPPSSTLDGHHAIGTVFLFTTSSNTQSRYKISGINNGQDKMYIDLHYKNSQAGEWQYIDTVLVNSGFEYGQFFGLVPNGKYALLVNRNAGGPYDGEPYSLRVSEVVRAANPLHIKGKNIKIKYSKIKKRKQTLAITKVISFINKGKGSLTFKKVAGSKKIKINSKTGKITIKKRTKRGVYRVKVKVKAIGTATYKPSVWKTVTFKIRVK